MSIKGSLSNALSGLTAASRAAQLVSNNVANATTEGYARREILQSSRVLGGAGAGVQIDGAERIVDQGILRDRRLADAALAFAQGRESYFTKVEDLVGAPDAGDSITGRLRQFESSLIEAASRPDSETRLAAVLNAATQLTRTINAASDGVQSLRLEADRSIADQVLFLNDGLQQVQDLNASISRLNGNGRDVSGLEDQRQRIIDSMSEIVPLREVPRSDGKVALFTSGGGILLDETARSIDFTPANLITSDMTLESGALSGLSIDGRAVTVEGNFAPLGGGSLASAFEVRDRLSVSTQGQLDALARDLVERFEELGVDPSALAGVPGLFTDNGAALDPMTADGLAGRLAVNAVVDPSRGGALRQLRDGLGATIAGDVGNPAQLSAFVDALSAIRTPTDPSITTSQGSIFALGAAFTSTTTGQRVTAESEAAFSFAQQTSLQELELSSGVDTDQELQKLLLIEQSYAANARVIQTIDGLIQDLLAI